MTLATPGVFCPSMPATLRRGSGARDRPARLPSVGSANDSDGTVERVARASVGGPRAMHGSAAGHRTDNRPSPEIHSKLRTNSAPPAATREDLQNMLETLRDPAKRDELAKQLETMLQVQQAAAPPEEQGIGASMLSALSTGFERGQPVHGECRPKLRRHRKPADLAGGPGLQSAATCDVA